MHEENNQFQVQPQPIVTASQPLQAMPGMPQASGVRYASFGRRLVATLIDSILVGFTLGLLAAFISPSFGSSVEGVKTNISYGLNALSLVYMVFMTYKYGATLGKKAMKIKVQKINTGEKLNLWEAILREFVGKILSSLILGLGYLWMLWDGNKQTWHDKIAGSVVVRTE